jgi:hypothetical protein
MYDEVIAQESCLVPRWDKYLPDLSLLVYTVENLGYVTRWNVGAQLVTSPQPVEMIFESAVVHSIPSSPEIWQHILIVSLGSTKLG